MVVRANHVVRFHNWVQPRPGPGVCQTAPGVFQSSESIDSNLQEPEWRSRKLDGVDIDIKCSPSQSLNFACVLQELLELAKQHSNLYILKFGKWSTFTFRCGK